MVAAASMNALSVILARAAAFFVKREKTIPGPGNDYWYNRVQWPTVSGISVDEKTALKYLTVFACQTLIAGDVARLPLNLYRKRQDGGKDLITDHRLYDLLHNAPNLEMTSFNWREAAQAHLLGWGNHYSFIEREGVSGAIRALWPIPNPGDVTVSRSTGGQIVYEYTVDGEKKTRTRREIFHIPGFGWNGLVGLSMIGLAREAIGMGLCIERFGQQFFGNGTHPSIAVTIPPEVDLGESAAEYKKALQESIGGLKNAHGIAVFSNGETFEQFTMPMDDAQFLESRDHQKIEICGMYHVPPHKIAIHGQNSNYNNLEQENASYVDSCLMHWLVRWESQISLQLLTKQERQAGLFVEFLVQGLLRGDSQARSEYYNKIFQVGGITPNEIRAKENMNPVEGGDQSFVMLNMVPLDQADMMDAMEPGNEPESDPDEETKDGLRSFFARSDREREERSIRMRDRISRRYAPLIRDAAQAIVSRETKAIKQRVGNRQQRDTESMTSFLNEFYEKFPEYINRKMGPVLRSYLQAVADESFSEIGGKEENLDNEIKEYIQGYADRHTRGSLGQMLALLETNDLDDLDIRADEWQETRAEKITTDETVRASSAAFSWVIFGAGMRLVWRARGSKTCPYCMELDGKRISSGEAFIQGGDELNPAGGTGPMRFFGLKKHPPLHQKCDCYASAM